MAIDKHPTHRRHIVPARLSDAEVEALDAAVERLGLNGRSHALRIGAAHIAASAEAQGDLLAEPEAS